MNYLNVSFIPLTEQAYEHVQEPREAQQATQLEQPYRRFPQQVHSVGQSEGLEAGGATATRTPVTQPRNSRVAT